ncbi:MAG TPA: NUDIX hydrolase [Paraburkholderia sp.]|nr:NUDIX hydrolase [Paraburkholderia sp.]
MARAAGILFVHDGRVFLGKRGPNGDAPGTWAFPGGRVENGESDESAARRELYEEMGVEYRGKLTPLYESSDGFKCFGAAPGRMFSPDDEAVDAQEHTDTGWFDFDNLPEPLHPGMKELTKMPSTSEKQHRAMEAAAHGNSTLGIPKKVGKEFVDADKRANDAADPRSMLEGLRKCAADCMAYDRKRK